MPTFCLHYPLQCPLYHGNYGCLWSAAPPLSCPRWQEGTRKQPPCPESLLLGAGTAWVVAGAQPVDWGSFNPGDPGKCVTHVLSTRQGQQAAAEGEGCHCPAQHLHTASVPCTCVTARAGDRLSPKPRARPPPRICSEAWALGPDPRRLVLAATAHGVYTHRGRVWPSVRDMGHQSGPLPGCCGGRAASPQAGMLMTSGQSCPWPWPLPLGTRTQSLVALQSSRRRGPPKAGCAGQSVGRLAASGLAPLGHGKCLDSVPGKGDGKCSGASGALA